jgi:hypothetical protein
MDGYGVYMGWRTLRCRGREVEKSRDAVAKLRKLGLARVISHAPRTFEMSPDTTTFFTHSVITRVHTAVAYFRLHGHVSTCRTSFRRRRVGLLVSYHRTAMSPLRLIYEDDSHSWFG